jgi:hypothetical protein
MLQKQLACCLENSLANFLFDLFPALLAGFSQPFFTRSGLLIR